MAQPPFKQVIVTAPLKYPELIEVSCDAHNWMRGWWFVAGNPYYAVTDDRRKVHDKKCSARVVHAPGMAGKAGTRTRKVTVEPDKTAMVDFLLAPTKE